jgi:hypothetical protein
MERVMIPAGLLALFTWACGGAPEPAPAAPAPAPAANVEEPVFKVWEMGALARARTDAALPFPIDAAGAALETPCFQRARGLEPWNTARSRVVAKLEANAEGIRAAIRAWAGDAIFTGEATAGLAAALAVAWETPAIVHAPNGKVRLAAEQACVDPATRSLPAGVRAVTTLFGAREVTFTGGAPLSKEQLAVLRKAAEKAKARFRPLTAAGETATKKQPVHGFRLSFNPPLWFAWGDLPAEAWAREQDPAACRLNLVFDDVVPRVPECGGPKDVGFGASQGETAAVVVLKVSADGVTAEATAKAGETVMLQAGGRVVVWLTPKPIIEGVDLAVDTLVLDPEGGPGGDLVPFGKAPKPKPAKKKP